jgi:uncharacterized protein (TIGR04222 family)
LRKLSDGSVDRVAGNIHTGAMNGYAADTWGISGPRFVALYAVVAGVTLTAALFWRFALRAGRGESLTARPPGPAEVAYLNQGPRLALYSSLAALRAAGSIGTRHDGALTASGPLPAGATDLDRATYHAIRQGTPAVGLPGNTLVARALDDIRDTLARNGWLYSPAQRGRMRWGGIALLTVAGLGLARAFAGLAGGKPVGYIGLLTVATVVVAIGLLQVPRTTPQGGRIVAQLRGGNAHLSPAQSPSWAVYGTGGAALGVALYGTASLWAADPAFAQQAAVARQAVGGSSGGDSGYHGGDSGSSGGDSGGGCGGGGGGGGGCGGGGGGGCGG